MTNDTRSSDLCTRCDTCAACRAREALVNSRTFTRVQVAQLIAAALSSGHDTEYERGVRDGRAEVTELTLDAFGLALHTPLVTERWLRMEGYRQRARREHDTAARWPWRGDHPGGPVPAWGES